jgi:hypothetical protein
MPFAGDRDRQKIDEHDPSSESGILRLCRSKVDDLAGLETARTACFGFSHIIAWRHDSCLAGDRRWRGDFSFS